MAFDILNPFGQRSQSEVVRRAELGLPPPIDLLAEARGDYNLPPAPRPISEAILQEMQRDLLADPEFRGRAEALAAQQFALATRGLPHHQVSLMRQGLFPSLRLGALQNQDLRARYQRERYGYDPLTRRFLSQYEEERIPDTGAQRRAIDLLQRQQSELREAQQPRLGEGQSYRFGGGS